MLESNLDLWHHFGHVGHRIAISTNGFVKRNGQAVMGRGCAKQATELFPGIASKFGAYLRKKGNVPGYLFVDGAIQSEHDNMFNDRLMILPVKHNWWEMADVELIVQSRDFLCGEAVHHPDWTFHVPRLGCGNGKLDWRIIREYLVVCPDNVVAHGGHG